MAGASSSTALAKRPTTDDVALMPPPPVKRIKRPPKVLDEDDYTDALSEIIARDYFPGLAETRLQEEYLSALDSGDHAWIAETARKLRDLNNPDAAKTKRTTRDARYDRHSATPRTSQSAAETPRGLDGSETPVSIADTAIPEEPNKIDTTTHSVSSFLSRYTSEDNASFNDVVDTQNQKRREKHAYLWTEDQRIPSARQIAHRTQKQLLLTDSTSSNNTETTASNSEQALIPLTTGATSLRPAKPDAWKRTRPDNAFMFFPDSVDDTHPTLPTITSQREALSKAGPKQTIHSNTRFPPLYSHHTDAGTPNNIPPSPSLNTEILANRGSLSSSLSYTGASTPRVNGYAYVDEDEPTPQTTTTNADQHTSTPTYRDLLAGQTASPFKFSSPTTREALHHRLVERHLSTKRRKEAETMPQADDTPGGATPRGKGKGNMTPAGARLMDKLGRTPVRQKEGRMSSREMWTPTPRKKIAG